MSEDLFQDPTTVPQSAWFKFTNIGDSVQGTLLEPPHDKEGAFGLQRVYVVETAGGDEVMVALKHTSNKRQIQQLRKAEVGDIVGFKYTGDFDSGKGNPAKTIEVRHRAVSQLEKKVEEAGL